MCNCWIGILNSYDQSDINNLYIGDYKKVLTEMSKHSERMNKISEQFKKFKSTDYIDKRKGMATLFNFCPDCGKKIDWKEVRKI